jgi:quercetin dioxygenase-like cupin family protein
LQGLATAGATRKGLIMALSHVKAGDVVDLQPLGEKLEGAKTTALVKTDAFEAIRLVIPAGRDIAPHEAPGQITLHCLEGRVLLELPDASLELSAGQWVYLDSCVRHALKGLEASSLLLTILFNR